MKIFLAIIATLTSKTIANNKYYDFKPIVHIDYDVLLLNISLSETTNASIIATQSIINISSNYRETIYLDNEVVYKTNNFRNKNSHWTGDVTFYNLDNTYHGKIIFSTCGIQKSCPVNDLYNSIQYIKGLIIDHSNNLKYSIFPQDSSMCPDNSNIENGTTIMFDHNIEITNYHRMLQDHNETYNETESCDSGVYPDDDANDYQIQLLTNYTSSNKRYALFKVSNDKKRCDQLGVDGASDETIDIMHIVNNNFGQEGIDAGFVYDLTFVLVEQVFFVDLNPWDGLGYIDIDSSGRLESNDVLVEHRDWAYKFYPEGSRYHFEHNNTIVYDIIHLFSNEPYQDEILGLAYIGTACNTRYGTGLNSVRDNVDKSAYIVSHEIGHNLGMRHDGDGNNCGNSYIMYAYVTNQYDRTWSSCSADYFNNEAQIGKFNCFLDYFTDYYEENLCGDGIIGGNEECDTYGIDDLCCNATSCTLFENALCSYYNDPCCDDQCQYIPFTIEGPNTICREATNECDSPEYCHGFSGSCPEDIFIANGQSCITDIFWNTPGTCYNGECINTNENYDFCHLQNIEIEEIVI